MHLKASDIREIVNDIVGKPEDLTGHERELRDSMEQFGIKLLDDWLDFMDTEEDEENSVRDAFLGFGAGFDMARGKVPV